LTGPPPPIKLSEEEMEARCKQASACARVGDRMHLTFADEGGVYQTEEWRITRPHFGGKTYRELRPTSGSV
jgi:hypothetical protein